MFMQMCRRFRQSMTRVRQLEFNGTGLALAELSR